MPSLLHEGLVNLFRDQPTLAPELLVGTLRAELPEFTEARIDSSDLTNILPAERRADLVIQLRHGDCVFGIVVEVQLDTTSATEVLDTTRSTLYFDLVLCALSEAARRALEAMDTTKYQYQSEFARRYFSQGKEAGWVEGRAAMILRLLALRFHATLPESTEARIRHASIGELDALAERFLTADTLSEALGELG
jgi:hypothetical protein